MKGIVHKPSARSYAPVRNGRNWPNRAHTDDTHEYQGREDCQPEVEIPEEKKTIKLRDYEIETRCNERPAYKVRILHSSAHGEEYHAYNLDWDGIVNDLESSWTTRESSIVDKADLHDVQIGRVSDGSNDE